MDKKKSERESTISSFGTATSNIFYFLMFKI